PGTGRLYVESLCAELGAQLLPGRQTCFDRPGDVDALIAAAHLAKRQFNAVGQLADGALELLGPGRELPRPAILLLEELDVLDRAEKKTVSVLGPGRLHRLEEAAAALELGVGADTIAKQVPLASTPLRVLVTGRDDGHESGRQIDALVNGVLPVLTGAQTALVFPDRHAQSQSAGDLVAKLVRKRVHPARIVLMRVADEEVILEAGNERCHLTWCPRRILHRDAQPSRPRT